MSIESMPEINVDQSQQLGEMVQSFSQSDGEVPLLVNITGSVQSWEKIKDLVRSSSGKYFSYLAH